MKTTKSMIDYIATCSKMSLESFLLARLNDRANFRKQMIEIVDELIENDVQARIAEWILVRQRRQEQLQEGGQELRRPPLHAHRNSALKNAGAALPRLRAGDDIQGCAADMAANPVVSLLRDAVPGPSAQANRDGRNIPATDNAQQAGAPVSVAHCAATGSGKSRRIA